jgi:hypothetical protein
MNPLRTSRTSNDEYSVDQINNYADNNVWIFFVLLAYPTVILIVLLHKEICLCDNSMMYGTQF